MPSEPPPSQPKPRTDYRLYIMRHGLAVEPGSTDYPDDSKRPLTPEGKVRMQQIAKGLKRLDVGLDWVVSSPLVRAVQTAEAVAQTLQPDVPLDHSETLSPGGSAEALIAYLAKHSGRRRVLVVGHEPDLGELAVRLIGAGRHAHLAFKKGGCCLIRFDEFPPRSPGELAWWLTPRILRRLA
ncbi:MAG TPA: phosphohistidine phosphatase SixA [Terriglobia bacterium]|nr:phosphohistidine phosphatase SixA [Terriglobia bacterium]